MFTIREFLRLASDESIMVSLYNTEDNLLENEALRCIGDEVGNLLRNEKYAEILDRDIESWEYIPESGIIEINYTAE